MTEFTALAAMRSRAQNRVQINRAQVNRAHVMEELRRLLPRVDNFRRTLPCGLAAIDSHLPEGGLACGALHEVVPETESALPAALGFICCIAGPLWRTALYTRSSSSCRVMGYAHTAGFPVMA